MPEDGRPVPPIVVKKYANRRLYDTESSIYITLDTLADMVRRGRDFVVYDAKTGDDITRTVLTQIIMEEEIRGSNMLPTSFLRQLIGFYGDSMQGLVPEYLERMMEQFAVQQRQLRSTVQQTVETLLPPKPEATGLPGLAVMDRAMSLFSPFHRPGHDEGQDGGEVLPGAQIESLHGGSGPLHTAQAAEEMAALREENTQLRQALARQTAGLAEPAEALRATRSGMSHQA